MWKMNRLLMMMAMLSATVEAATNIDAEFTQDGVTTYCQGVNGNRPSAVTFMALETQNNGLRCPISLTLTVSATNVYPKTNIDVTWKATVRNDAPDNIFPSAVDRKTKKAQPIVSSLLKLCRAGTNCASVLDLTPVGPMEAEAGAFDEKGEKALRAFKIQVNEVGGYVLVGKIALPGDPALNISAMEMVTFQKITVVDTNVPLPASPSPAPTTISPTTPSNKSMDFSLLNEDVKTSGNEAVDPTSPATVPVSTSSPKTNGIESDITQTNVNAAEGKHGFLQSNSVLLMVAGVGAVLVGVVGYMMVGRRRTATQLKGPTNGHSKPSRNAPQEIYHVGPQYVSKSSTRHNSEVPIMARDSTESGFSSVANSLEEGTFTSSNKTVGVMLKNQRKKRTESELLSQRNKYHLYSPADLSFVNPPDAEPMWSEDDEDEVHDLHDHSADVSESEEEESRWGDSVASYQSEGLFDRSTTQSGADSFAFRPTDLSVAESYDSRISKYSEDSRYTESFRSTSGY